jgi:hypothetical protein
MMDGTDGDGGVVSKSLVRCGFQPARQAQLAVVERADADYCVVGG